jgi:hypothetical protein
VRPFFGRWTSKLSRRDFKNSKEQPKLWIFLLKPALFLSAAASKVDIRVVKCEEAILLAVGRR